MASVYDETFADEQSSLFCPETVEVFRSKNSVRNKKDRQVTHIYQTRCSNLTHGGCDWLSDIEDEFKSTVYELHTITPQIDLSTHSGRPTKQVHQHVSTFMIESSRYLYEKLQVRKNTIEVSNDAIALFDEQKFNFNDFAPIRSSVLPKYVEKDIHYTYELEMEVSPQYEHYDRKYYSYLNMAAEFGGVFYVLVSLVGFLLMPLQQHQFMMKLVKKLYLASTKDKEIFEVPSQGETIDKSTEAWLEKTSTLGRVSQLINIQIARISCCKSMQIFFARLSKCRLFGCFKDDKVHQYIEEGERRMK